jgi:hypothetical protein
MGGSDLKDLVKPPFANYDIVVYFGCGLFSLPLAFHYFVEPLGYRFPRFSFEIGIPIADTLISTLSLLFSVYILGHVLAYIGSVFVEKTIDSFFGKVSSAILISGASGRGRRSEIVSAWLYDRFRNSFRRGRRAQSSFRLFVHLPVLPLYALVLWLGGFDYYRSRIPYSIISRTREKLAKLGLEAVGLRRAWYKPVEHIVMNNLPVATARMYNYLVISGVFRTVSVLLLGAIWMETYYAIHWLFDGHYLIKPLMHDQSTPMSHFLPFMLLYATFGFSIASYMKFSRRYAEEAVFAFALAKELA